MTNSFHCRLAMPASQSIGTLILSLACLGGLAVSTPAGENPAAPLPFKEIGHLASRDARAIAQSDWSIGGETLDRDFASYAAYESYLGPLGAKGIRLQAGWAKTERTPGVYDWKWLDVIVANAVAQGVKPWIQLSYGNPAYSGGGGKNIGDAMPSSPEAIVAWNRWAEALVRRYRDRVDQWEIWNEPDLSKKATLDDYTALFIRTADIIRREQPDSKIYALALAHVSAYADDFLAAITARKRLDLIDAITFHDYPENPDNLRTYLGLKEILKKYPAHIALRQGETGAPSQKTTGALRDFDWSETRQVKWDLRRMLAHHGNGVPVNLFTLSDFYYPNGLNAKGLVKIRPDLSVIGPKPAYFAAQRVFALFDSTVEIDLAGQPRLTEGPSTAIFVYHKHGASNALITLWLNGQPPQDRDQFAPVSINFPKETCADPVYVDLRTGRVYEIPPSEIVQKGEDLVIRELPIYDSPVIIASKGDLSIK